MLQKLSYIECNKGDLHHGELVNFACIEKECSEKRNSIGCSVCMEQEHYTCRKSPLKYLCKQLTDLIQQQKNLVTTQITQNQLNPFEHSSQSCKQQKCSNGDSHVSQNGFGSSQYEKLQQNLLDLIASSRGQILESVLQSTNALIEKTRNIQRLCIKIFDNVEEQARQKIRKENEIEGLVNKIMTSTNTISSLQDLLHQIFSIIPSDSMPFIQNVSNVLNGSTSNSQSQINGKPENKADSAFQSTSSSKINGILSNDLNPLLDSSQNELLNLHENLDSLFSQMASTFSQKNDLILAQLNLQEKYLNDLRNDNFLIQNLSYSKKLDLTFSASDKHPQISIIKPNLIKSSTGSSSNYKFALTNSELPMKQITKFAFKFQNINSQNWIAIGVALKKVIKSKNYSFSLSLGHGAYMISSNSGSWSHSEAVNNNVVKSFDFQNNSIVECTFDPIEGYLSFQLKDNPSKKYKLQIDKQSIGEDTYHPCVLFYYPNDEVELLHPYS